MFGLGWGLEIVEVVFVLVDDGLWCIEFLFVDYCIG